MHNTRPPTIQEMRRFTKSTVATNFKATKKTEMYTWFEEILRHSRYLKLPRPDKKIVRQYIQKITGLKHTRLTELIRQFRQTTRVQIKEYQRHSFSHIYTTRDTALLARADLAFRRLAGLATLPSSSGNMSCSKEKNISV